MNETIVIDVVAKFKDQATESVQKASKSVKDFAKNVENISKKKHSVRLGVEDKATSGIRKVMSSASAFSKKTFKGVLSVLDKATPLVEKAITKTKGFVNKAWKATLSVVDKFTTPLTKLKNMLFNINTLIGAVATGLATKLVVANPISEADTLTTSTIFFETKLGSAEKAEQMMSDIMKFAKETPFDTQGVVDGIKQMMAYGIEADKTLGYMEKIGNATSALGSGEAGIDSVTRALGQMRSAGKVNAQDMMQLTSAGITAWDYLAKGMGKSVAEVREMASAGAISADEAIKHIMNGLSEFDGMMDKMSTRTVSGLWSNIKDAFDQSIVLEWGKGLQKGAVNGLVNFKNWLDRIDPLLSKAGTSLSSLGEALSTKVFDVLGGITSRFEKTANSDAFANASLGGKIKIVWDDVIWKPFSEWWESTGKPKVAKKLQSLGESIGKGISGGLLTLLGVDAAGTLDEGLSLGANFANGFIEGFDGEAVGDALWEAIKRAFKGGAHGITELLLPGDQGATGGEKLLGAGMGLFGLSKLPSLIKGGRSLLNFGKGIGDTISVLRGTKTLADVGTGAGAAAKLIGSTGNAIVNGSGLLGSFASAGYALTGGAAGSALSGTAAAALGGGSILGGILGFLGLGAGAIDIYQGAKATDKKSKKDEYLSGGSKLGMVGSGAGIGALIGSVVPVLGTGIGALIGAGVGGLGALFGGDKFGEWISDLTDEGGALNNMGKSIKQFFTETIPEKWNSFWDSVGAFFTETVPSAVGRISESVTTFFTETIPEKWTEFWDGVGDFFTETVPYAIGYVAGKITTFFTETIPEKWTEFWDGVSDFFTETIPAAWETLTSGVTEFFTVTIPEKWNEFWTGVGEFFTETIPAGLEFVGTKITEFFTVTIPAKWDEFWTGVDTFFTETIPTALESVGAKITAFFTETLPAKWESFWNSIDAFFTETIPQALSTIGSGITTFFTETIPGFFSGLWNDISSWISEKASSFWNNIKSGFSAGKGDKGATANNASGGFVSSRTLSWLAEEGYPEAVIPFAPHRRDRALSLWQKTGEMLGVKSEYNALGGIVGGNVSESPSNNSPLASYRIGTPGNISISIGNITFEIKSGDNPSDILTAIKAQKDAIVEVISEALYEALVSQFSNTPLAVS